jgi:anti-sigma-K factor RskA
MKCEELKDLFELYSLGVLDGEEKREAATHLARGCDTCRRSLTEALAVNALLLASVPSTPPPSRLKHRVLAGVGLERSGWGWLGAMAAALMLVVALWLSVQERQRTAELADARRNVLQVAAERDRLQQVLGFLDQPETRQVSFGAGKTGAPHGNVFIHPRLGVLLVATGLPALPPGRTFEMWVTPKGGVPRPAGRFQAGAEGFAVHMLSGPIDIKTLSTVTVSVEPAAGSPEPTTTPVVAASTGS